MNKIYIIFCAIFCLISFTLAATPKKVFVSQFEAQDDKLKALKEAVALDFQTVFHSCKKAYKVLDRRDYNSWIGEEQGENNRNKHQLHEQDVDYHLSGEVHYNGTIGKYIIEYSFAEVETTSMQFIDNIAFDTYDDLMNNELRLKSITNRLIKEFAICVPSEAEEAEPIAKEKSEPLSALTQKEQKPPKVKKEKKIKKTKASKKPSPKGYVKIRERVRHRFKDLDKDGVPDLIDKEKNTPMNVLVNKHGEMISPDTEYIVKRNNNEKKSDKPKDDTKNNEINSVLAEMVPTLPVVRFEYGSTVITEEMYSQLHHLAMIVRMYPALKVVVTGNTTSISETLAYKRSDKIIKFMDEHYSVKSKRFILNYKSLEESVANTVIFEVMTKVIDSMPAPQ